jgi:hypothetical protein
MTAGYSVIWFIILRASSLLYVEDDLFFEFTLQRWRIPNPAQLL